MSYQYIKPSDEQIAQMQKFRDKFEALHKEIEAEVEHSRGRSLCFTKLEEAAFWLNKSITKNDN